MYAQGYSKNTIKKPMENILIVALYAKVIYSLTMNLCQTNSFPRLRIATRDKTPHSCYYDRQQARLVPPSENELSFVSLIRLIILHSIMCVCESALHAHTC